MILFILKRIFGGVASPTSSIALKQTALDMMKEVFCFFKSGSHEDALTYIEIAKKIFKDAGSNPDTISLTGLMPPSELVAIETLAELEEYIKYIKEEYDACLI